MLLKALETGHQRGCRTLLLQLSIATILVAIPNSSCTIEQPILATSLSDFLSKTLHNLEGSIRCAIKLDQE